MRFGMSRTWMLYSASEYRSCSTRPANPITISSGGGICVCLKCMFVGLKLNKKKIKKCIAQIVLPYWPLLLCYRPLLLYISSVYIILYMQKENVCRQRSWVEELRRGVA